MNYFQKFDKLKNNLIYAEMVKVSQYPSGITRKKWEKSYKSFQIARCPLEWVFFFPSKCPTICGGRIPLE
jgi:hypothetical protein